MPGMGDFHRPCNCQMGRDPSPPPEFSSGGCATAAMLLVIGVIVCVIAILI